MLTNNVPQAIIDAHTTRFDQLLNELHDIFIQNKFMTLFSILFGYGFGVIMQRLEKKSINSTPFFLRRMFWLFIFGCLNLALWNGDILHLYAVTGIFLLLFRKQSDRTVLLCSFLFLFIVPTAIRFCQHFFLGSVLTGGTLSEVYYNAYRFGSLKDIAMVNYKTYIPQWIYSWVEWRDMSETFGRFLFGYYILRRQLLTRLDENFLIIKKIWRFVLVVTLADICLVIVTDRSPISIPRYILYPFLKMGIFGTALFYATSIVQLYKKGKLAGLMKVFRDLGRMTLTNYLVQTIIYVVIFYGLGLALLGDFSFGIIWLASLTIYFLQGLFSKWWLSKCYYGPVEWVWRQLTYRKRFRLIRSGQ